MLGLPMPTDMKYFAAKVASIKVLVVDDEYYMRKVVRTLLMSIGVRNIYEAQDGPAGLESIRTVAPDSSAWCARPRRFRFPTFRSSC